MKIKRIVEDDWSTSTNAARQHESVTIMDVLSAVRRLNGEYTTLVVLEADDDMSLSVGGGNNGRYVLQITKGVDEKFYTLCHPTVKTKQMLEVLSGGQSGMYAAKNVVDLNLILRACEYFAETALPAPDLRWEVEGGDN